MKRLINVFKNEKTIFILILFLAFFLRCYYIFFLHPPERFIYSDMQGYYERALKIANGMPQNVADTLTAPGTHFFYSICFYTGHPFLILKLMNLFISLLSCYFIFLITKELFSRRSALIAFFISSINFLFIDFTGYILSETPFIFFFSLLFYLMIKSTKASNVPKKCIFLTLAGLCSSIAVAIRPGILIFILLFILWNLMNWKKQKVISTLFFVLGYLPIYTLLTFHTYQLTGNTGFVSTNGGLNFYQGRSHVKDIRFIDSQRGFQFLFASPVAVQKGYDFNTSFDFGPYESARLFEEGMKEARKDIPRTIFFSLEHILDLFHTTVIWPSCCAGGSIEKIVKYFNIFFIYIIILPSILPLLFNFRRFAFSNALLLYIALGSNIIVTMIYYGDPRFRVPFDMFSIILTAYLFSLITFKRSKQNIT
jgi:4-amino-4-deoxy-L-arabinose transferase-like glycosyltransferase